MVLSFTGYRLFTLFLPLQINDVEKDLPRRYRLPHNSTVSIRAIGGPNKASKWFSTHSQESVSVFSDLDCPQLSSMRMYILPRYVMTFLYPLPDVIDSRWRQRYLPLIGS